MQSYPIETKLATPPSEFADLFPHRWDWIAAPHPAPGDKPQWRTESRYPLSNAKIEQGAELYGVRFGPSTRYALLDIDRQSAYHPKNDAGVALQQLADALEGLGITDRLAITSSHSGGLHLYLPFGESLPAWKVGKAITLHLESKGFKVIGGQLEVFPQARNYSEQLSLYAGHRLPLQAGSSILNVELSPVHSSRERFAELWHRVSLQNDVTEAGLDAVIKRLQKVRYAITTSAEKFLQDLDEEIGRGWEGPGQTNRLLGRIALRCYVFGRVLGLSAGDLTGPELIAAITTTAEALPGFSEFCSHKETLTDRAKDWARSVEQSQRYYPYQTKSKAKPVTTTPAKQTTRERIACAMAKLRHIGQLPTAITARFKALVAAGIGGGSLYRNRDLWHPAELMQIFSPLQGEKSCNESLLGGKPVITGERGDTADLDSDPPQIPTPLGNSPAARQARAQRYQAQVERRKAEKAQGQHQKWIDQLQDWLRSGDPILAAEAQQLLGGLS